MTIEMFQQYTSISFGADRTLLVITLANLETLHTLEHDKGGFKLVPPKQTKAGLLKWWQIIKDKSHLP